MTENKVRGKHIGYGAQREQCRLNKYTYIEKINGAPVLFCNYPFSAPEHKKGLCKAGTCTDMRSIPADVVAADMADVILKPSDPVEFRDVDGNVVPADDKVEVPGEAETEDTVKTEDTTDNG